MTAEQNDSIMHFPKLAFLVFRSRSGSTLIADRLGLHDKILVTPESEVVRRLEHYFAHIHPAGRPLDYSHLIDFMHQERKLREWEFSWAELEHAFIQHNVASWEDALRVLSFVYRNEKKQGAEIVIIKKNSWNYKNIDRLLSINSDVKSIWVFRDPRATYNSSRAALHSHSQKPLARSLLKEAFAWMDYMQRMERAGEKWQGRVVSMRYETFLADLHGELNKAWNQLGIDTKSEAELQEKLRNVEQSHLVMKTTAHLHANVSKGPQLSRIEGWRIELPRWKARLIKFICKSKMVEFNYH